jgi:two-component sensor histidine kinase
LKNDNLRRGVRLRALALFSAVLGVIAIFVLSSLEQRRRAIEEARESLLYEATIAASMVSADLRVVQITVESLLSGRADGDYAKSLPGIVLRISGATNAYLLDSNGKVLASAFRRRTPSLSVPGGLSSLVDTQIGVAFAEAEGGYVLAFVSNLSPSRRVAVLFRHFSTQGPFVTLLSGRGGLMTIRDASGAAIRVDGSSFDAPLPLPGGERLEANFAMPSFPLTVSVGMEKGVALAEWRESLLQGSVFVALFSALVVTLLAYGNRLQSRGLEAQRLASELALKELLFKEANHRVKNNLAIVQGILHLSASEAEDGTADAEILDAAASRVESIALLHDTLSHLPIGEDVMLDEYLGRLLEAIVAASRVGDQAKIETDLQEDLAVDLDVALPCGLIVNELVTNAIKYAFPNGRNGTLRLSARKEAGDKMLVRVEDDGVGYETTHEAVRGSGLGMQIVTLLADQIGATIERSLPAGGGCVWSLAFTQAATRH